MLNENHLIQNFLLDNDTVDLAIEQGKTYNKLVLKYPANLTVGIFKGQIRKTYYQDNGELLGEFEFETPIYEDTKTIIKPFLTAETTENIPYTKFQGIGSVSIKNCWVYDIEHHHNLKVTPITRGFVQVIPEVTRS